MTEPDVPVFEVEEPSYDTMSLDGVKVSYALNSPPTITAVLDAVRLIPPFGHKVIEAKIVFVLAPTV